MAQKDLYKILDVQKTATAAEIKKANGKAQITYHPDKVFKHFPGIGEAEAKEKQAEYRQKLQAADEAFKILGDEKLRKIYDEQGYDAVVASQKPAAPGVQAPNSGVQHVRADLIPKVSREDMGNEYRKWNDQSSSSTPASKPAAPIIINSAVDPARSERLARFTKGNNTPAQPPQQERVTVIQRETEKAPVPVSKPEVVQQTPVIEKIEKTTESIKNTFNDKSVTIPLDTLERISDNLESVLKEVKAQISKAKGNTL